MGTWGRGDRLTHSYTSRIVPTKFFDIPALPKLHQFSFSKSYLLTDFALIEIEQDNPLFLKVSYSPEMNKEKDKLKISILI